MRSLSFVLALILLVILAGICFAQGEPPAGYTWSAQLPKPPALTLNGRRSGWGQEGGNYDFCVTTVGDNWCISNPTGYGTIWCPPGAMVSVRFPAGVQEPSCGWLCWRRGPYANGTPEANRGPWKVGQPENAGPWPMVSMPIITHHGGDFQRYWKNGWPWLEANYFSQDGMNGQFYRRTTPKAPLNLDGVTRPELPNPEPFAPDLTLLCAVTNAMAQRVAICWVDQFGRESELSDKTIVPMIAGTNHTYLELSKRFQPPQGAVAFRVYAGPYDLVGARGPLYRQPVLDRVGAPKNYDWPLHLSRFYLHQIETNNLVPNYTGDCRSWLSPIQQELVAGKMVIHRPGSWRLYCPLVLTYDPLKFGRKIGGAEKTTLSSETTASPAVIVCNQRDRLTNVAVIANSCAVIASSDFSGGQAFSNEFHSCSFQNSGVDGYGLLVDECSSYGQSEHTTSEAVFRNCQFNAARPVKLEGNQTAKVRFDDRCSFNCNGRSRYLNEVCALQIFTSNAVVFDVIEGVNDYNTFRTFCGMYSNAGAPTVRIKDVFIDRGCSVLFAYGPNTGGVVELTGGDKVGIYAQDRSWFRLAECPNSNTSRLSIRGLQFPGTATILSYNLNQLAIDLDRPIAEVVTPTESDWISRGLLLQFAGKDWRIKQGGRFDFAISGSADTLPVKSPKLISDISQQP